MRFFEWIKSEWKTPLHGYLPLYGAGIVSFLTISCSLWSLQQSFRANEISREATKIARDTYQTSEHARQFEIVRFFDEKRQESVRTASDIFEKIPTLVIKKISNNQTINSEESLLSFVNTIEDIGARYCAGTLLRSDVRADFGNILNKACYNKQIVEKYRGIKNGFSLLCLNLDISGSQGMAGAAKNKEKCSSLDDAMNGFSWAYKELGIPMNK